jgi:hypothetical protein
MKDYNVKGTPLPPIPSNSEINCGVSCNNTPLTELVSYGITYLGGYPYVNAEKSTYRGDNYYMVKLSHIEKLDKENSTDEPLPEKWCILRNLENYNKINNWLNENIGSKKYYGNDNFIHYPNNRTRDGFRFGHHLYENIQDGYKKITFEQFKKHILKETTMETRKITSEQAQSIIDIACDRWRTILSEKWGKHIVLKSEITVDEKFYLEMRKACTNPQNELFDKIFGKDEPKFKAGDWVTSIFDDVRFSDDSKTKQIKEITNLNCLKFNGETITNWNPDVFRLATKEEIIEAIPIGTPCLVRDEIYLPWNLAYHCGKGLFKYGKRREKWVYFQVLDMDNLPQY